MAAPASGGGGGECVQVVIRCRPLNDTERSDGNQVVVSLDRALGQVTGEPRAEARLPLSISRPLARRLLVPR